MATYPSTPPFKSSISPLTETGFRVAASGLVYGRSLITTHAYQITVIHPACDSSAVTTLQSFFATNQFAQNEITVEDGDTYDCWFKQPYEISLWHGSAVYWELRTVLIANPQ